MNLALVDQALFVIVQKLYRVLDRDHMLFALVIDLIEHGGERRRFPGPRGARHQHEAARLVAKALDDRRQAERVETLDLPWNGAEHRAHGATLVEQVAAESRQILEAERKIELQVFLEPVLLGIGQYAIRQRL